MTARLGAASTAYQAWQAGVARPQLADLARNDARAAQALQADLTVTSPLSLAVRTSGLALTSQVISEQQQVTDTLNRVHTTLLAALIAMIVVVALIAAEVIAGVWRGLLRPIGELNRAVAVVAEGRYHRGIPAVGPPELADLSRGVERMRTRLVAALNEREQAEESQRNLFDLAPDAMVAVGRLSIGTGNSEVDAAYAAQRPALEPGRYCQLTVSDTGTGMDQATIDRVFEPFFSTKPRGRGTGLGLATVYGIVSSLGGTIDINSQVGLGTIMNVLLPVAGEPAAAVPEPSPPADDARGQGETILLVEDEDGMRAMAGRILSGNGYLVREAADGAAAVRLAGDHAERLDLLLTDMDMPGMPGNEVVDRVHALRPGLPAICITGSAEQVADLSATGLDIVRKPFTETVLLTQVRRALDKSGAHRGTPS
jgi:CheY-like chemotaxis protein